MGKAAEELLKTNLELESAGVRELPEDFAAYDVIAVASDRPYPAVADQVDRRCWTAGIPWCEATLVAHEYRVGPMVVPAITPCHDCWRRRVASHAQDPDLDALLELVGRQTVGAWYRGELESLNRQVAAMLAAEILGLASGRPPAIERGQGRFWAGDAVHGGLAVHQFSRIGRCRRCARPEQSDVPAIARIARTWQPRA